ncbi:MAG: tetratricopeptide repeat protein [Anaerolineae bacterium]|nr:tetratricopeptide repeat protein [Anaerolineae bacterium]
MSKLLNGSLPPLLAEIDRQLEQGDIRQAEIIIARRLRRGPVDGAGRSALLLRRARVRLFSEKPGDALADLREAFALDSDLTAQPEVRELLADVHFARFELAPLGFADRADADQALAYYRALAAELPNYPNQGWVSYQTGRVLLSANRVDEAVSQFEAALGEPSWVDALRSLCFERLGFVELFERRNPAAALACFAQAIDAYPAGENSGWLVQLHILRSRALREQKDYIGALNAARQALRAVDSHAPDYRLAYSEAHLAVGEALAHFRSREEDAIDHLVRFLQLGRQPLGVDVTWGRVYETIGALSLRLGRYGSAAEAFDTALAYNPTHPLGDTLQLQIARARYDFGDYARAAQTLESLCAAAEAEGDMVLDYRVYSLLADSYAAQGAYHQAADAYAQAVTLTPSSGAERAALLDAHERALRHLPRSGAMDKQAAAR